MSKHLNTGKPRDTGNTQTLFNTGKYRDTGKHPQIQTGKQVKT